MRSNAWGFKHAHHPRMCVTRGDELSLPSWQTGNFYRDASDPAGEPRTRARLIVSFEQRSWVSGCLSFSQPSGVNFLAI